MEPGHEDREYRDIHVLDPWRGCASMEPGHEDREYYPNRANGGNPRKPQWSPVMKTGNTRSAMRLDSPWSTPQWSPVMKTGNTRIFFGRKH